MTKRFSASCAALLLALATGVLAACGGGSSGHKINVSEVDYKILPDTTSVAAGKVTFKVTNNGTFTHEFVVDRAASAASLPLKSDGEVNEDSISASNHLGEVEDIDPGKSKTLTVTMTAGQYVLFCNRVDGATSHFKKGMHTDFTVTS
jgi:uncharacterized cupredoxin-like copper-binding protein